MKKRTVVLAFVMLVCGGSGFAASAQPSYRPTVAGRSDTCAPQSPHAVGAQSAAPPAASGAAALSQVPANANAARRGPLRPAHAPPTQTAHNAPREIQATMPSVQRQWTCNDYNLGPSQQSDSDDAK